MPIQLLLAPQPETADTSPEDAKRYLDEFVAWLHDFFAQIGENLHETDQLTGNRLFEEELIRFFPAAFTEIREDGHFDRLRELIVNADPEVIVRHGLYGAQLQWKLSNINFHFTRFIEQRTAALLNRLLTSVDTLLRSLLSAVPGGSAIEELKEAMQDSLALATQ